MYNQKISIYLYLVLFYMKYTYLVNIANLLLFLSLKTHTFTDFLRNLLLPLSNCKKFCSKFKTVSFFKTFWYFVTFSRYFPVLQTLPFFVCPSVRLRGNVSVGYASKDVNVYCFKISWCSWRFFFHIVSFFQLLWEMNVCSMTHFVRLPSHDFWLPRYLWMLSSLFTFLNPYT